MLMKILGRDGDDTTIHSAEEIEARRSRRREREEGQQPRGFTIESAAEMIDNMPPNVPRESAVRIVRGALAAAGIEVSSLERFTRAQMSKLSSEIEVTRSRQEKFREETEEAVRSLEGEIRKLRETCDTVITEEEKNISRASVALREVGRIRAFFDFPRIDGEANIAPMATQDTQPLEVLAQLRRSSGPLAGMDGPPNYGASHSTSEERQERVASSGVSSRIQLVQDHREGEDDL
jgi:hypothetical protein